MAAYSLNQGQAAQRLMELGQQLDEEDGGDDGEEQEILDVLISDLENLQDLMLNDKGLLLVQQPTLVNRPFPVNSARD